MSLDILHDQHRGLACLFDKTRDLAIECPIFMDQREFGLDAFECATDFLQWLQDSDLPPTGVRRIGYAARDPRSFEPADLHEVWLAWHEQQIDNRGITKRRA